MRHATSVHLAAAIATVFFLAACTQRYKLVLSATLDSRTQAVKPDGTEFFPGMRLVPELPEQFERGNGNVLVVVLPIDGERASAEKPELIAFDQRLAVRLYLQLQEQLSTGTQSFTDSTSYLLLLGDYTMSETDRLFRPLSGELTIDSLVGKQLFATIDASFENPFSRQLQLRGQFKGRVQR